MSHKIETDTFVRHETGSDEHLTHWLICNFLDVQS